jgi:proline iminopeptidase
MNKRIFSLILSLLIPFIVLAQTPESFQADDGETLYYTRSGSGTRVILLCGGPGFGASFMYPWLDSLANQFEVVLLEQRGTGLSAKVKLDSTTINLQRACQDIDDLRNHFGDNKLTICGYSWGGMLALAYAARYPDHVRNLVLLSTGPVDPSMNRAYSDNITWNTYPAERDSAAYWSTPEHRAPNPARADLLQMTFSLMNRFYDHNLGREMLEEGLRNVDYNPVMAELMWKDIHKDFNFAEAVICYKGQCNIIRPRQDVIPAEVAFKIKETLPQSKIYFIERCGHLADLEKPKELFSLLRIVLAEEEDK